MLFCCLLDFYSLFLCWLEVLQGGLGPSLSDTLRSTISCCVWMCPNTKKVIWIIIQHYVLALQSHHHPPSTSIWCSADSLYPVWEKTPIKAMREQNLIKRSIKLTLSPAACFSACAARWGPRAGGWGTRSRLWWETPSRRCNRNPEPGGPLHLWGKVLAVLYIATVNISINTNEQDLSVHEILASKKVWVLSGVI